VIAAMRRLVAIGRLMKPSEMFTGTSYSVVTTAPAAWILLVLTHVAM
jgi:hypothetical protein